MRGYAALDDNRAALQAAALAHDPTGSVRLGHVMGDGYIAFTVDDGGTNGRYQGIVELDDQYLSDAAMRWYENSEQLDTVVVCVRLREFGWLAGGGVDVAAYRGGRWQRRML